MSQSLPFADIKYDSTINSEKILSTTDYSNTGHVVEVDSEEKNFA